MSLERIVQNRFVKAVLLPLRNAYLRIRFLWPIWFYIANAQGRNIWKRHPQLLSGVSRRIADELAREGIAVTTLAELFPEEPNLLARLQSAAHSLIAENAGAVETNQQFLRYLWEFIPTITLDDPYVAFAVSERVLGIVNTYMQMWSRLYLLTLNLTSPVGHGAEATMSQLWHRDGDDKRICKLFLYLNDVDEDAGPFRYIKETAHGQKWEHLYALPGPISEEGVNQMIVQGSLLLVSGMGKAGTVIICDTTGIHKGGYATAKERIMFTAGYRSAAAPLVTRFRYSAVLAEAQTRKILKPVVRYALSYNHNPVASWLYSAYSPKKSEKIQRSYERARRYASAQKN